MSDEYGITFTKENCIQCHACEVACKSWNGVDLGVKWRRVETIWKGVYPDVRNLSASVACMHCAEPACVKECPEGAISKRAEDGVVLVDMEKCIGCRTCLEACPFDAPAFGTDGKMQKCDLCFGRIDYQTETPPCVATCPTEALAFGKLNAQDKKASAEALRQLINRN